MGPPVTIDLPGEAWLPRDYVPDFRAKIDVYHRLSRAANRLGRARAGRAPEPLICRNTLADVPLTGLFLSSCWRAFRQFVAPEWLHIFCVPIVPELLQFLNFFRILRRKVILLTRVFCDQI